MKSPEHLGYKKSSISIRSAFTGTGRGPRNILGFHDGVSNSEPSARQKIIELPSSHPSGLGGSSFICFIRMPLNMTIWPDSESSQEKWVGRTLQSGASILADGTTFPSHMIHSEQIIDPAFRKTNFIEAPSALKDSHVEVVRDSKLKIFRQGYEFLEFDEHSGSTNVGLNFISFQNSPATICSLLAKMKSSFSPNSDKSGTPFATADAAGLFFVPSRPLLEQFLNSIPNSYPLATDTPDYTYVPRKNDRDRAEGRQEASLRGMAQPTSRAGGLG